MPTSLASNRGSLAGFDVRKSNQSERDARRDEINRIETEFWEDQKELRDFVRIGNTGYRKSEFIKVTFGDSLIYARFTTGDVVEVTEDQLRELANTTGA
jgi:hypothetical protein